MLHPNIIRELKEINVYEFCGSELDEIYPTDNINPLRSKEWLNNYTYRFIYV